MNGWIVPGLSAIGSGIETLFGLGKKKRGYEMSEYEKMLYEALKKRLEGEVPSSITAPFVQAGKDIKQQYARQAGSAGIVGGFQEELAAKKGETISGYKEGIERTMASLVRGTGTEWAKGTPDIGMPLEDIGWMLFMLSQGKKPKGEGGGAAYPGGYPSSYNLGY